MGAHNSLSCSPLAAGAALLLAAALSPALSPPDAALEAFSLQRHEELLAEYHRCTGDSSARELSELLGWKEEINRWSTSTPFDSIARIWHRETGIQPAQVLPCDIYLWMHSRAQQRTAQERAIEEALQHRDSLREDSLAIHRDLSVNPATPFDFPLIPFGVSPHTLTTLLNQRYTLPVQHEGSRLLVHELPTGSATYTVAFDFDPESGLYRYELQSPSMSADSLDAAIRPLARELTAWLEERLGPPDHLYRTGFFDIIQGRLAPHAIWHTRTHSAVVGYATFRHRYYAKCVVTRNRAVLNKQ